MTTITALVKLNAVNHVIYVVKEMKRALEFYTGFLGLTHIEKMVDKENIEWLILPNRLMVHLIERPEDPPSSAVLHTAFEVEDFDAAVAWVEAHDIPIVNSGVRRDGQRFLFIHDPDGNRVELCTPSGF